MTTKPTKRELTVIAAMLRAYVNSKKRRGRYCDSCMDKWDTLQPENKEIMVALARAAIRFIEREKARQP